MPLIEIARAETEDEAMAGLERWKERHPDVWPLLEPRDVLVDKMRGRSSVWYRIRLNLQHVPEEQRPRRNRWKWTTTPGRASGPSPGRGRGVIAGVRTWRWRTAGGR